VSIENVSVLLGHSSVRITERHYKPWVKTLQKKLEDKSGRRGPDVIEPHPSIVILAARTGQGNQPSRQTCCRECSP